MVYKTSAQDLAGAMAETKEALERNYTRFVMTTDHKVREALTDERTEMQQYLAELERRARGDCFVATACFEDAGHPTVTTLRAWRDSRLSTTAPGRAFIAAYWKAGPQLARAVNRFPSTKAPLRNVLTYVASKLG